MSSARQQWERRKFEEEYQAEQERLRIEAEKPLREIEKQLQRNAAEFGKLMRETILSGPDPEFQIPASASALAMSEKEAAEFMSKESDKFLSENPDYFPCRENFDAIIDYLLRNKIEIPTAECFKSAWLRLKSFGLIEERPIEPEPQVIEEPQPDPAWEDYTTRIVVRDPLTGTEYTQMQLDHNVDSMTYKRLAYVMRQSQ